MTAPAFHEQTWDLEYRHALGDTIGRFLGGLTERRLLGRRCPGCERVLLPARAFCDRCHRDTTDWVEVAPRGELAMFTIVYEPFRNMPEPPYVIAYALLEGADTALLGYLKGVELADVRAATAVITVGAPVRVVFADEPAGRVTDYWFELDRR
ncbi:MAG TPA: Zn-ribbon domain-containing OB-fold protein [Pseudonocardiaceae bacterium]